MQPFRLRALDVYTEVTALPVTALGSWGEAAHNTAGSLDSYFPLSQCCKSFYPHLSDSSCHYLLLSFPSRENSLFHTKRNYFAGWYGALGQCCQSWRMSALGAGVKGAEELDWQGLPFTLLGGNSVPGFEADVLKHHAEFSCRGLHCIWATCLLLQLGIQIVIIWLICEGFKWASAGRRIMMEPAI